MMTTTITQATTTRVPMDFLTRRTFVVSLTWQMACEREVGREVGGEVGGEVGREVVWRGGWR